MYESQYCSVNNLMIFACFFLIFQGWKKHGSYCYFVGTETKTFDEANNHCKSSESYLADVSNG